MAELYFYPEAERELQSRDKPKGPYVHLEKSFRNYRSPAERKDDEPEFVDSVEDYFMDVSAAPNFEAIGNLVLHQGARVLGFGNFPATKVFIEFAQQLKAQTSLALLDPKNPTRMALEKQIIAEQEAKLKAEEEAKANKKGKAQE